MRGPRDVVLRLTGRDQVTRGAGAETERKKHPERERKQKRQNESWREEAGNRRGRETEVYGVKTEQEVLPWYC